MISAILDHTGKPMKRPSKAKAAAKQAQFLKKIRGTYDAAQGGPDIDKYWANADSFDADSANSPDVRRKLVKNSRYETANNGYSDGMTQTYATDLVGTGPQLRMQTTSKPFNQMVARVFWSWMKAAKFRRKFWTMAHAKDVDGECFAIIRFNKRIKHPVQLDIALRETEQCKTPMPSFDDPTKVDGIQLDEAGEDPIAYEFLSAHPGKVNIMPSLQTMMIPADRVLHWFKLRRPGQHRGVPERASTLNLGAAFRRLREASLSTAEKVAAWTLFMESLAEPDEDDEAFTVPMSTVEIVHGMLTALPNGMKPHQLTAEQPGPTYDTFHRSLLSEQGRPKNMPYNKAACDSSSYNYASGRLDHQTYYGNLDVDREDGNDLVLDPLFDIWFNLAISIYGWLGGRPRAVGEAARYHTWDWPKHRAADIQAEANANQTKLKSGQIFIQRLFSDNSMDFEDEVEAAAEAMNVTPEELKTRLFDILFPPPKTDPVEAGVKVMDEPAVAAIFHKLFQRGKLNGSLNGNGAHHG